MYIPILDFVDNIRFEEDYMNKESERIVCYIEIRDYSAVEIVAAGRDSSAAFKQALVKLQEYKLNNNLEVYADDLTAEDFPF